MSLVSGLLNQIVDNIYSVTTDGYGDKTTTTLYSNVSCRWEENVEQEVTIGGELIKYDIKMWVLPEISVKEGYRISKKKLLLPNVKKTRGLNFFLQINGLGTKPTRRK